MLIFYQSKHKSKRAGGSQAGRLEKEQKRYKKAVEKEREERIDEILRRL